MATTGTDVWKESVICIKEVEKLLADGYEIEVDSPDGWVPVTAFVDKGMFDEYVTEINGTTLRTNEGHLFETDSGWMKVKDIHELFLEAGKTTKILSKDDGFVEISRVFKTGNQIPIVDIQVDHENHRYYSEGYSSHNTGVGKSLFLCDYSANALLQGYNVLYITLEMAEEKIAERIDCNIMDVKIQELQRMGKKDFDTKLERLKSKTKGQLVIKEYPTSSAHAGHFKALLDDLRIKKGFVPDIICVDYLNICASQRYKGGSNYNSYFAIKATAEELRGVAVEYNVAMITATQSNKDGMNNSDIDMTNTSESSGTPMTLDFYFAIIRTEELDEMGQLMVKQLKSRFGDINYYKRFVIGVELSKFKLYNIDDPTADLVDVGKKDNKPSLSGGGMKQNFDALNFE